MPYGGEKQAISNQLEMASMMSDANSVPDVSPMRSSKIMSTRGTKAKIKGEK